MALPPTRRSFLTLAATFGFSGCSPERATTPAVKAPVAPPAKTAKAAIKRLPVGKARTDFIVHRVSPPMIEPKRQLLGRSVVTPLKHMYVLAHNTPPQGAAAEPDAWQLECTGAAREQTLTLAELKQLGDESVASVLQCAGNGRSDFEHDAPGVQWNHGAMGCAVWRGVPLHAVADHLGGVDPDMRYLTVTGMDPADESDRRALVERSIPIDKALKDCLLAWQVNDQPIPLTHGGPLRLIVPGYYGINNIKYAGKLAFTREQTKTRMMSTVYRLRPVGEEASIDDPTTWGMRITSLITAPLTRDELSGDGVEVQGVAVPGESPIDRVEVSLDGGGKWQLADLVGPDLGPYAWRQFRYTFAPQEGESYQLASRAWDRAGNVQPQHPQPNEGGYVNNSWFNRTVSL